MTQTFPETTLSAGGLIGTFGPTPRESGAGVVFAIESDGRLAGVIDGRVDLVVYSLVPDDLQSSGAGASLD